MGCGQKAVSDDEDDWDDLKRKAGIQEVSWQVYSFEAGKAKEIFTKSKNKTTGLKLKLLVNHAKELRNLEVQQAQELKDLENALAALKKFA